MKRIIIMILLCVCTSVQAQSNFVLNSNIEKYESCPIQFDQLIYANYWKGTIDSSISENSPEYYNRCANTIVPDLSAHVPNNSGFYQNPHSGDGMAGCVFYYDKTLPAPPPSSPFAYRDYLQGHLVSNLISGKMYCVSFWVNCTESFGYAHNKIGAYLDDGSINTAVDSAGKEITSVVPQVYTDSVIKDTMNWTRIEGSFVANGTETYITIGNFFPNFSISTVVTNYWAGSTQSSYYLIDDVSVIPIDLDADAGADTWVEEGKMVQIGRVGDTTAIGLDCKWYHKGTLIDSGAIISVNANSIKYAVDTFVVVQTICGLVKTDTVLVKTVGLGMKNIEAFNKYFNIYPNPSSGTFTITATIPMKGTIKIYDLIGKLIYDGKLKDKETNIQLNTARAVYIVEVADENQNRWRERIVVE